MSAAPTVAFAACGDYTSGLAEAIAAALAPLGGLARFVAPGQAVLIKPNLLTDRVPEQAVTTHPEVVRALVAMVRACGGRPAVGDSPASAVKLQTVWEKTGFQALCAELGVPLLNLEQAGSVPFERDGYRFSVARPVVEADVVISVPKVKTHALTAMTAGVKNLYGTLPGYQKAHLHRDHADFHAFGALVAAVARTVKPALTVADGVVGMEGEGPSAGRPVRLGFVAAADDPFALDLALCDLLGIPRRSVPFLRGCEDMAFRTAGAPLAGLRPLRFDAPGTLRARLIPSRLLRLLKPLLWVRPAVGDACVFCGRCAKACPVQALDMQPGCRPALDARRCIGCCCCHEVCPAKAIRMVTSPLLRAMSGGKLA